jgi:hypothetical protein
MAFRLTDEQVVPSWKTCTVEVIFAPKTGSQRPWELYGCFTYPHKFRRHWGSFKTEAAAQKAAEKARANVAKQYFDVGHTEASIDDRMHALLQEFYSRGQRAVSA